MIPALRRLRHGVGRLLARAIALLLRRSEPRVILDGEGVHPYLSRWYLWGAPRMPDGSSPYDKFGNPRPGSLWNDAPFGLYVHRFHRSDLDRELHNHPWRWAISLVVAGGYREERRSGDDVVRRVVPPLSFNFLRGCDFHRIDLIEGDAWTIFLVGPKMSSWGFWSRHTGEFTPWREFLRKKQRSTP